MEFQAGTELGPYRLIKRLGAGGMGEVWEAEDPRLGRTVAIKILPQSVAENNESKARLTREARTAAQLYHANIATIHSIEQAGDRSFIVMEYVTGETLGSVIRRGPIDEGRVCNIGKKVALALAEAHEHGIIHRDIKPDNIIVSGDRVKVLDFGIAKQIGLEGISGSDPTAFVTQAGMIVGTVHYMSPEQALGKPLDGRSDIFSLGVVLYQALTGRLPFEGETVTETITRIIRDEPEPIRTINPRVSESMAALITKCLDKNRENRFASAGDLAAALEVQSGVAPTRPYTAPGVAAAEPPRTMPASAIAAAPTVRDGRKVPPTLLATRQVPKGKSPAPLIVALIVALIAAAATAWYFSSRTATKHPAPIAGATVPVQTAAETVGTTPTLPSLSTSTSSTTSRQPAIATSITTVATSATSSTATAHGTPSGTVLDVTGPPTTHQETSSVGSTPSAATSTDQEYAEGLRLMQRGDGEGALNQFRSVLAIDPHAAAARLKEAQIELRRHRPMLAAVAFRETLRDGDRLDSHDHLLAEAGLAVSERRTDQAQQLIVELETTYPHDLQVRTLETELEWERDNGFEPNRIGRRRRALATGP